MKGRNKRRSIVLSQNNNSNSSPNIENAIKNALTPVIEKFADVVDKFDKSTKESAKNTNNKSTPNRSKNTAFSKGRSEMNDIFGKNAVSGWSKVLGKKGSDSMIRAFKGLNSKKGPAGDVLKNAMGGAEKLGAFSGSLAKAAGGMMKFAGHIGAAIQAIQALAAWKDKITQMGFELGADLSVLGGDATKASGDSFERDKAAFMDTEAGRKKRADWNFMEPLRQEQAMRNDMFGLEKQAATDLLGYEHSLVMDDFNFRKDKEADLMNFAHQQAMQTFDANAARTKTLFTLNMGYMRKSIGVSERALQAIGSSTQALMDAVKNVGVALGTSLSNQVKMATSAAGLGAMFGASADEVLGMSKTFRLMDKSSADQAINMTAGLKSFARMNDMEPAQLFKEMADSQEEIFKYSNYTSDEFARQVVLLKNMNTSMSSMAKASDTMVLNYKDSMKAEMGLSAMLGKNVDLSETRARLMSGDMAGGASALKSALGGMDINAMNPFAKQQLSQATGMNIDELLNLTSSKGGGAKGSLEEKNAAKTGAAIANGALAQDISNEATKLAMEQAMREKMMKFEQDKRLQMLEIEQLQRLDMVGLEAKFRIKAAKMQSDADIETMIQQERANAASGAVKNLFGDFAGQMKEQMPASATPQQMEAATSAYGKAQSDLSALIQQGYIKGGDSRILDFKEASKTAAAKGKTINAQDYFGGAQELAKKKADDLANKEAELKKQLAQQENDKYKGAGNWAERNLWFYRMADHGGNTWMDKQKNLQDNENSIQSTKDQLAAVQKQKAGEIAKAGGGVKDVLTNASFQGIQSDNTKMIVDTANTNATKQLAIDSMDSTNSGLRGIIHQKEFEYGNRIANEQIAQQATTNALLTALISTTEKGGTINLDGIKVNKTLLNQNRTSYGLVK